MPSCLWLRGKTASPRRRPASSGLRNRRLQNKMLVSVTKKMFNKFIENVTCYGVFPLKWHLGFQVFLKKFYTLRKGTSVFHQVPILHWPIELYLTFFLTEVV